MPNTKVINSNLLSAAWEGKIATVQELLDAGADVNSKETKGAPARTTALMLAVIKGYTRVVEILVDRGADVNAQDKAGYTALRFAQEINYPQLVNLLKKAGARH